MSGDLVPERGDLRASHEDRDHVVDQLRIAAGDGRLTAEELDERLERAIQARTYGELETLVMDLPPVPSQPTAPFPMVKEVVQLKTRSGDIRRIGPWPVPRRLEVDVKSGSVVLDFTQAVLTQSVLDLTVAIGSGSLTLIVSPGIAVDVDSISVDSGNIRQRVRPEPGAPVKLQVAVSGHVKSGNVTVRAPRRTFWDWLRRRPLPPG
jgi:hypothetical protein